MTIDRMYSRIMQKELYLTLHRAAHNNAIDLLAEAEILFERERYSRAYSLAFTALEEISKSQLAADGRQGAGGDRTQRGRQCATAGRRRAAADRGDARRRIV